MTEMDFIVSENLSISPLYGLLKLTPQSGTMPDTHPGQFVQVEVPHSKTTFLRRPISICYVDEERNQLWLLIRKAGEGTASLLATRVGETLNLVMPLGNGFCCSFAGEMMLIGGQLNIGNYNHKCSPRLGHCFPTCWASCPHGLGIVCPAFGHILSKRFFDFSV